MFTAKSSLSQTKLLLSPQSFWEFKTADETLKTVVMSVASDIAMSSEGLGI